MTGLVGIGDARSLQVRVDYEQVARVFKFAPKVAHFWMQGFLFASFRNHRLAWLKRKGVQFGRRGKGDAQSIKVHEVNRGPAQPTEFDVVYNVEPREQRAQDPEQAIRQLRNMRAEAFAGSVVLRVHEFGEDIRTRGFMAVPVKTRPGTPKAWLAKNPSKRLEYRPSKKVAGEAVLYEVQRVRRRGRPRKDDPPPEQRLRLRFLLKRFVDMRPTLNMYATWQELQSQRDQLWRGAAEKMEAQLQAGDPRDF